MRAISERPRLVAVLIVAALAVLLVTLVLGMAIGAGASSRPAPTQAADRHRTTSGEQRAVRAERALRDARTAAVDRERELESDVRRWRRIAGGRGRAVVRAERRARRRD